MSATPLVSILIPTYNRAHCLEASIRSALAQTYQNIEVLVGDNLSTDGTPGLLAAIGQEGDTRFSFSKNASNVGPNNNIKGLISRARGEYFLILSSDDIIEPRMIELSVNALRDDERVAMVHWAYAVVDEHDGRVLGTRTAPPQVRGGVYEPLLPLLEGDFVGLFTAVVRKDAFDTDGAIKLVPTVDWLLWLMLAVAGWKFHYGSQVMGRYAISPDADSSRLVELENLVLHERELSGILSHEALKAKGPMERIRIRRAASRGIARMYHDAGLVNMISGKGALSIQCYVRSVARAPFSFAAIKSLVRGVRTAMGLALGSRHG